MIWSRAVYVTAVSILAVSVVVSLLLKIFGPAFDDTRALH